MTLQKAWVNGAAGDTADLTINGSDPTTSASATSTATGAAVSETDTINQATAIIFSGQTVNLAEDLGAGNTGSYTSQITCDKPGLTPDPDGRGGSLRVPTTPVAVICTIINARTSAPLILRKEWVNGAAGDTVGLTIATPARGGPSLAVSTATGAAGSEIDTVNQAITTVFSGETVDLAEVLDLSNTGRYTSAIVCDQRGLTPNGDGRGGTYLGPAAPDPVTCTITNTRRSASLTLRKEWVNAAVGDTTALLITGSDSGTSGSAISTATGATGSETDTVNLASATIFAGGTVTLVEALGAGNIGSYSSQIACTPADGFTAGEGGQGGSYQVPADPVDVTCTITNARTATSLILQKEWVNGAPGDTAALSIDGATTGSGFATAVVPANGNGLSTDKAMVTVLSGASVDLAETLGSGNTGSYTSTLACDRPGLTSNSDGRGGSYQVPAIPVPVNCTFINTRTSAPLTLRKTWVNGAAGDQAALSASGSTPAPSGSAISTATGAAGSETDVDRYGHHHDLLRRHRRLAGGAAPDRAHQRRHLHLRGRLRPAGPDPEARTVEAAATRFPTLRFR